MDGVVASVECNGELTEVVMWNNRKQSIDIFTKYF